MFDVLPSGWFSTELVACLAVLIISWLFINWLNRRRNLPPGPWGLPLIGASFRLSANLHDDFVKFGGQYGNIFSLYLGRKLYVVLNNAESIHEGFGKMEEFSARPKDNIIAQLTDFNDEILNFPYGERWKENKKFATKAFRSFGFGTDSIESKVLMETQVLADYLVAKKQEPVELNNIFRKVCANVILSFLVGTRYDWEDDRSDKIIQAVHDLFQVFQEGHVALFFEMFPSLSRVIFRKQVNSLTKQMDECRTFMKNHIEEHRVTLDPAHTRDVLDVYLKEGKLSEIGEQALIDTMLIFLPDGFETNGIVLGWIMLYVTAHPEVQTKIHQELDDVIGQGRPPTLSDRALLPYTEAAMLEAFRASNCITLTVTHKPIRETRFRGFLIPENAYVVGNIFGVHCNPEVYPDPQSYKPERFLGEAGQKLLRDHFMPFSVGRRMCMGEAFIKLENFLIFATLLHRFNFSFPSDEPPPSLKPVATGAMILPPKYKLVATPR